MRDTPERHHNAADRTVKDIRRKTRKRYSSEDKIRIVLAGLRGEDTIAELCRQEGIAQSQYYSWSKEFMEAGRKRLAGDTAREANMRMERSIFGKIAKYMFILFNIIMLIALIFLSPSIDEFDVSSPELYKNEEKLSQFMLTGTLMYFLFFVWAVGDLILGVWVLCTRPKK